MAQGDESSCKKILPNLAKSHFKNVSGNSLKNLIAVGNGLVHLLEAMEAWDRVPMPIEFPGYRRIRDVFVLNCYTGLRHSDWSKVLRENIQDGKLFVKTQKTNEPVIIPVKPLVREILDKYDTIYIPSNQKTNDSLRWIGQKAHEKKLGTGNFKKWLEIRTHTARRSFATNAYLAGIPMRDIMQITGHRTTGSFLTYIRATKIETAEKLKDHPFFS